MESNVMRGPLPFPANPTLDTLNKFFSKCFRRFHRQTTKRRANGTPKLTGTRLARVSWQCEQGRIPVTLRGNPAMSILWVELSKADQR